MVFDVNEINRNVHSLCYDVGNVCDCGAGQRGARGREQQALINERQSCQPLRMDELNSFFYEFS